jgi:hypothetical protein
MPHRVSVGPGEASVVAVDENFEDFASVSDQKPLDLIMFLPGSPKGHLYV